MGYSTNLYQSQPLGRNTYPIYYFYLNTNSGANCMAISDLNKLNISSVKNNYDLWHRENESVSINSCGATQFIIPNWQTTDNTNLNFQLFTTTSSINPFIDPLPLSVPGYTGITRQAMHSYFENSTVVSTPTNYLDPNNNYQSSVTNSFLLTNPVLGVKYYVRLLVSESFDTGCKLVPGQITDGVTANRIGDPRYNAYSVPGVTLIGNINGINSSLGENSTASGMNTKICTNTSPLLSLSGFYGVAFWQYSTLAGSVFNDNSFATFPISPIVDFSISLGNRTNYFNTTLSGVNPAIYVQDQDYNPSGTNASASFTPPVLTAAGTYFYRASIVYNRSSWNNGVGCGSTPCYLSGPCTPQFTPVVTVTTYNCVISAQIINTLTSVNLAIASSTGINFDARVFNGLSSASSYNFNWTFDSGAIPATYSGQTPPSIIYTTSGVKFILLSVSGNGISSVDNRIVNVTDPILTDIKSIYPNASIYIYPNPTSGKVNITATNVTVSFIEVYNTEGNLVQSQIGGTSINIAGQPSGIYTIWLKDNLNRNLAGQKIVKQ